MRVQMTINGSPVEGEIEPRLLLVQFIRDVAGLKGTNIGCDTTSCGACTVLMEGQSVKSCTVLAAQADGASITTIEGLAPEASRAASSAASDGDGNGAVAGVGTEPRATFAEIVSKMHPVQRAFHEHHGLQCGYCTPGMVMAVTSLIAEAGAGELTEEKIRLGLEGNLCRCTGYHNIVEAAMAAAREAGVAAPREANANATAGASS